MIEEQAAHATTWQEKLPEFKALYDLPAEPKAKISENAITAVLNVLGDDVSSNFVAQELISLKEKLAQEGLYLDKFLGAGATSLIFTLKDINDKPLEDSVARVTVMNKFPAEKDVAAMPMPIKTIDGEDYSIAIMSKLKNLDAVDLDVHDSTKGKADSLAKDLSGFSEASAFVTAQGYMDRLRDFGKDQVMGLPDLEHPGDVVRYPEQHPKAGQVIPVFNDLGCFATSDSEMVGMGNIDNSLSHVILDGKTYTDSVAFEDAAKTFAGEGDALRYLQQKQKQYARHALEEVEEAKMVASKATPGNVINFQHDNTITITKNQSVNDISA